MSSKKYYLEHREERLAKMKEYRLTHSEELKTKKRNYYYDNREEQLTKSKEYRMAHREERNIYAKNYHWSHREKILQKKKTYHLKHREEDCVRTKKYRLTHHEELSTKNKEHYLNMSADAKEAEKIRLRNYKRERRLAAFKYFSDGKMCCACCGENQVDFLSLDHVNGGGY